MLEFTTVEKKTTSTGPSHTTFCLNRFRSRAILIQSLLASSPSKPVCVCVTRLQAYPAVIFLGAFAIFSLDACDSREKKRRSARRTHLFRVMVRRFCRKLQLLPSPPCQEVPGDALERNFDVKRGRFRPKREWKYISKVNIGARHLHLPRKLHRRVRNHPPAWPMYRFAPGLPSTSHLTFQHRARMPPCSELIPNALCKV